MAAAKTKPGKIPKAIAKRLRELRAQIKRWVLVHGLGRWLLVVLAVLACDVLLDRLFKMDFAQRLIMLCVMAITIAVFFFWRVLKPVSKTASNDALLHEIELAHPEWNESVISSAQLAQQSQFEERGVSDELAQATIDKGIEQVEKFDASRVLDSSQNGKNLVMLGAGGMLALLLAVGVFQTDFLRT